MATSSSPASSAPSAAAASTTYAQFESQLDGIRQSLRLTRITDELEGMPISALPEGVYGYSYSQPSDEMPLFSKRQYQCFEWHKHSDGAIFVLGFAKAADAATLIAGTEPVDFNLYPEPWAEAATLVQVEGRRIRKAKAPSRSDGNYMALNTEA